MGYSEILCHICGVSFNIGRLRAPGEPRTSAWNSSGYRDGQSFIDGGRNSWIGECERQAGCMLVYRGDQLSHKRLAGKEDDDDDDAKDEDYVVGTSNDETDVRNDEAMEYEYETPPESRSGADTSEDSDEMSIDDAEADIQYREFVDGLRKPYAMLSGKFSDLDHDEVKKIRTFQAQHMKPEDEVTLPLFRPLSGRDEDAASLHGSDASFENDEPEGPNRSRDKLDHWWTGKLSSWGHPLNGDKVCDDYIWEHVAGPDCFNYKGYNGNHISVEEMQGCNTSQALIPKAYIEDGWQPEDGDEPWEQDCSFFLSGLNDQMPSRDISSPDYFPARNGCTGIDAENVRWNVGENADGSQYGMPFHPTCLEVYKRACLKRYGSLEIEALASWWLFTTSWEEFNSGWPADVMRGQDQFWHHGPGDEYLAANPCIIPRLEPILESARGQKVGDARPPRVSRSSSFESLPAEIHRQIFDYLSMVEVAQICLAVGGVRALAQDVLRDRLLSVYPHLWELWCDKPYSRWVGTTAGELGSADEAFYREEKEIEHVVEVLDEEDRQEERECCERYWSDNFEERHKRIWGDLCLEKSVTSLKDGNSDFARFVVGLTEADEKGGIKGLKNRERIWKQCQRILDRIEDLRRQGKIRENGTAVLEASQIS